jgi:hypothetical protein
LVYIRKRAGRRRSFFEKHKVLLLFVIGAGACLMSFFLTRALRSPAGTATLGTPGPPPAAETTPQVQPAIYERIVYPYSVIPGGVRNREELVASISNDPVVAGHYAQFAVSQARMVKMEIMKDVHVSYRIRDKIFWTAKAVKIPEGETLITDGRDYARARCGNLISVLPQSPVSEEEPEPEYFEIPVLARLEPPAMETLPESGLDTGTMPELALELKEFSPVEPYFPMPPPAVLPYYYPPIVLVSPPGDIAIPEPGTFGLLLAGLTAVFAVRLLRKK